MSLLTNSVVTICPIEHAAVLVVATSVNACNSAGHGKRDVQDSEAHDEA